MNLTFTDQSQSKGHLGPGGRTLARPGPGLVQVLDDMVQSVCVCLRLLGGGGAGVARDSALIAVNCCSLLLNVE